MKKKSSNSKTERRPFQKSCQNQSSSKSKPINSTITGKNSVLEALNSNSKISKIWVLDSGDSQLKSDFKIIEEKARKKKIPVSAASREKLKEISGTEKHKSIVAQITFANLHEEDFLYKNELNKILIAANIEDPHNLGAMIRTAHAFGFDAIVFPNRRSSQITDTVITSSAGAAFSLPLVRIHNINQCLEKLKKQNFWVYGTDVTEGSQSFDQIEFDQKSVLVLGNEGKGLSDNVKKSCDFIVHIPIKFNSLNVSVATGVILSKIYLDEQRTKA